MHMVLLKRFVAYKTCLWYRKFDLRATVYVLYTTCVLKGRSAMWNESEVQSSEPTSVRPGLMSASWFQVVSWLATKLRGGKSRKDDMETWYLHLTGWWRPALPFIFRSNARWTSIWRVNCAGQFLSGQIPLNSIQQPAFWSTSLAPPLPNSALELYKHLVLPSRYLYIAFPCIPHSV